MSCNGNLLEGQSGAEEVKERNVKVFEKKSDIFQKYIGIVWEVWKDHKINAEEYENLTGLYYRKLMLYMKKESTRIVGEELKSIGPFVETDSLSGNDRAKLQKALINIINTLSNEISLGGQIDEALFIELDKNREAAAEVRNRRQNRSFKTLGIKTGTELVFKTNSGIKCKTVDEKNKVRYEGKEYSLSGLAGELLDRNANGFAEFTLEGKVLSELWIKTYNWKAEPRYAYNGAKGYPV